MAKEDLDKPVENSELELPVLKTKQANPPPAWKPGVTWDGNEGEITSRPTDEPTPHWNDILQSWGYDPKVYELIEPIKVSTWDAQASDGGTKQLWSYKAGIRKRIPEELIIPYDDLVSEIKNHRPSKKDDFDGEVTFVVCLADWQIGKPDGDGLSGTIQRILEDIDAAEQRVKDLKKIGRKIGTILIVGLGDIIEGCSDNYSTQVFGVEANRRSQVRIARRLIRDFVIRMSKLANNVVVSAVPGNHGENRKDYRAFTNRWDNDDVSVFECVAEILDSNPQTYSHVEFRLPEKERIVMFDCNGVIVGFAHGHDARGGNGAQNKLHTWWKNQSFGEQPVGDASILITGHYHHLSVIDYGKKTHIQCPANDGGSEYWVDEMGSESPSGTLTLTVGSSLGGNGYSDLLVL
jgi:predicted phosphodiesterase